MLIDASPTLSNAIMHHKHLSHLMAKSMNELAHKSPLILYNCMQCIDGSSILLQRYVTKGNDAKNPGGVGHGSRDSIRPTNVVSAGAMVDTFFVAS